MTMMPTMTLVYSPDGKESGNYRENEIPDGWLRTDPNTIEVAGPSPTPEIKNITADAEAIKVDGNGTSEKETEEQELVRLQAELDKMDEEEAKNTPSSER